MTHCRRARLLPERPAYPALGSRHRRGNTSPRLVRSHRPRDRQKIRVPLGNFRNLHSQSPTIEPTLGSAKSGRYRGISARACSGWCAEKRIPGSGTAAFIPRFRRRQFGQVSSLECEAKRSKLTFTLSAILGTDGRRPKAPAPLAPRSLLAPGLRWASGRNRMLTFRIAIRPPSWPLLRLSPRV